MAEEHIDPSGNTDQWRAFAQGQDPAVPKRRPVLPIVLGVLVAVVILGALALLAFM